MERTIRFIFILEYLQCKFKHYSINHFIAYSAYSVLFQLAGWIDCKHYYHGTSQSTDDITWETYDSNFEQVIFSNS